MEAEAGQNASVAASDASITDNGGSGYLAGGSQMGFGTARETCLSAARMAVTVSLIYGLHSLSPSTQAAGGERDTLGSTFSPSSSATSGTSSALLEACVVVAKLGGSWVSLRSAEDAHHFVDNGVDMSSAGTETSTGAGGLDGTSATGGTKLGIRRYRRRGFVPKRRQCWIAAQQML